jgi:hypothetical protein
MDELYAGEPDSIRRVPVRMLMGFISYRIFSAENVRGLPEWQKKRTANFSAIFIEDRALTGGLNDEAVNIQKQFCSLRLFKE